MQPHRIRRRRCGAAHLATEGTANRARRSLHDDSMKRESSVDNRIRHTDLSPARTKWLLWPLAAAGLLITVQAWSGVHGSQQGGGFTDLTQPVDPRLSPTTHPAVPARLEDMWFVPADAAAVPTAVANAARGVQMLDQNSNPADALPLLTARALAGSTVE